MRYAQSVKKAPADDRSLAWGDLYPLAGAIAVAAYIISECF